jgi:hypothetical protein
MTLDQYLEQERAIRKGIHQHDGVWWHRSAWGSCTPLYPLQPLLPGQVRPAPQRAPLRYRFLTPDQAGANHAMAFMVLAEDRLRAFSFDTLPHEKRKAINRAEKTGLRVQRLCSLEDQWPALKQIFISNATRTGYGLPPAYYETHEAQWKADLRREFALADRDWFAAFAGETVVAYLYCVLVEETALLLVTKFNAAFLESRPSDALHFHALSYYRDQPACRRVSAGSVNANVATIDRFKSRFGFEPTSYPAFQWTNRALLAPLRFGLSCLAGLCRWQTDDSRRNLKYFTRVRQRALSEW